MEKHSMDQCYEGHADITDNRISCMGLHLQT